MSCSSSDIKRQIGKIVFSLRENDYAYGSLDKPASVGIDGIVDHGVNSKRRRIVLNTHGCSVATCTMCPLPDESVPDKVTVTDQNKFPSVEHFAALVFDTIYIPGDERSRTNPGHGYPASTESVVKYITFKDLAELNKWVTDRENPKFGSPQKNYKVISSKPLSVSVKVDISV